jgi:hypothetical protein
MVEKASLADAVCTSMSSRMAGMWEIAQPCGKEWRLREECKGGYLFRSTWALRRPARPLVVWLKMDVCNCAGEQEAAVEKRANFRPIETSPTKSLLQADKRQSITSQSILPYCTKVWLKAEDVASHSIEPDNMTCRPGDVTSVGFSRQRQNGGWQRINAD